MIGNRNNNNKRTYTACNIRQYIVGTRLAIEAVIGSHPKIVDYYYCRRCKITYDDGTTTPHAEQS